MAPFVFDSGPGGSTAENSQSASSSRDCFGLSGIAGGGAGQGTTAIVSSSCGVISGSDLKRNINSKADWYAALSPTMTLDGLRMGCDLSRPEAKMYLQKLGRTFTVGTLRGLRAVCR